ncbi:hypothetical protein ColLi_04263 [Colletotrichum liriopes]|uniref:DUF7888 domain-containing protein n=1 Tax=Colletotrichum liriopes TaxID=708192 RepID=A0AA37GI95_9PEZI|nr:hypothetical protein ColLi_04263 [Colletotrichum liriopes]
MHFSAGTLLQVALCASTINALALPRADINTIEDRAAAGDDMSSEAVESLQQRADAPPAGQDTQALQKRVSPAVAVIAGPAINVFASVVTAAIHAAIGGLASMAFWNPVRENFTKNTVKRMWDNNPDHAKYPAAICYNKGYGLQRPQGIIGLTSAKLTLGALNTDYDCMYMEGNNQFYTHSEGGYINLAYHYDGNRCTHLRDNGDLHCR